jgi:hypothetical protein
MTVSERRMVNKPEAVGDSSGCVAGEQRLLEAGVGSRGLWRHNANQITNGGDDIRCEGSQNMTVAQVAVRRKTGDYEFCLCIVKPSYGVLFPEGGEEKAVRRGGRRVVGLERLRQGLDRGGGGDGRLRCSRLIHLHHCMA